MLQPMRFPLQGATGSKAIQRKAKSQSLLDSKTLQIEKWYRVKNSSSMKEH